MYQEIVLFVVRRVDTVEKSEQRLLVLAALCLALLKVKLEGLVHQRLPFQDVCVVLSLDALPFVLQLLSGTVFELPVQLLEVIGVVAQQELKKFLFLAETPSLVDPLNFLQRDICYFANLRLLTNHFAMRNYTDVYLSVKQHNRCL